VHSDWDGQYVPDDLLELVSLWKIRPSMSRANDPYDNSCAESFWSGLKAEMLEGTGWPVPSVPGRAGRQSEDIRLH